MSYSSYYKRVNRYGNNLQERIQGKKEHDFLTFMSKSPNLVCARNGENENYYNAVLQTKEYDQDEVTSYLLVPLDKQIPMGTVIYTKDTRHSSVIYEEKEYVERRWINYAIDPYTSTGYNRYTVVELESEIYWVDEGIRYSSFAHATGGGSGARDKNINLKFNVQFSEAGVYLPNKRYSVIMPTHSKLKKNMKVTLGGETWKVTGFDSISVKGVSYVTLEETLTDTLEDKPIANTSQLKNWTVATNLGENFSIETDASVKLELYFFYKNEKRTVPYKILKNGLYEIVQKDDGTYLHAFDTAAEQVSLKVVIEGWSNSDCFEIPFEITDYTKKEPSIVGPKSIITEEIVTYVIKNVKDANATLKNSHAEILSQNYNSFNELEVRVKGKSIGKEQLCIKDTCFDFEVLSMWMGGI